MILHFQTARARRRVATCALILGLVAACEAHGGTLVWTLSGSATDRVQTANTDGTGFSNLVDPTPGISPWGLTADPRSGSIYWSDVIDDVIYRADADGSNVEVFVDTTFGDDSEQSTVFDLAFHHDRIYWSDATRGTLNWATTDGSIVEVIVDSGLNRPRSLAVDPVDGHIYITDFIDDEVYRTNLDGTDLTPVLNTRDYNGGSNTNPRGVAIDPVGRHMFVLDATADLIARANLDGSGLTEILDLTATFGGPASPNDLALLGDRLYWVEGNSQIGRGIYTANLDGSDPQRLIATPDGFAAASLVAFNVIPEPSSALLTGFGAIGGLLLLGVGRLRARRSA